MDRSKIKDPYAPKEDGGKARVVPLGKLEFSAPSAPELNTRDNPLVQTAEFFYDSAMRTLDVLAKTDPEIQMYVNDRASQGFALPSDVTLSEEQKKDQSLLNFLLSDKQRLKQSREFKKRRPKERRMITEKALEKLFKMRRGEAMTQSKAIDIQGDIAVIAAADPYTYIKEAIKLKERKGISVDFKYLQKYIPFYIWKQAELMYVDYITEIEEMSEVRQDFMVAVKSRESPVKKIANAFTKLFDRKKKSAKVSFQSI